MFKGGNKRWVELKKPFKSNTQNNPIKQQWSLGLKSYIWNTKKGQTYLKKENMKCEDNLEIYNFTDEDEIVGLIELKNTKY